MALAPAGARARIDTQLMAVNTCRTFWFAEADLAAVTFDAAPMEDARFTVNVAAAEGEVPDGYSLPSR